MNYLAHAYLSFQDPGLLIGNMIGDFVKGKQYLSYPEPIQKGILLHRNIDTFTDYHPITSKTKDIYKNAVGLYSGSFLDISYDYFLANDEHIHSENEWRAMVTQTYTMIHQYLPKLPDHFGIMFGYMEREDWLYNYRFKWRIHKSFQGLAHRAKFLDNNVDVFPLFEENILFIQEAYKKFFPEIKQFALDWIRDNK